jgi:hypothetical protein
MITIGVPILGDPDARQEWPSPGNSTITKLLPSTVGLIGTYSVGQLPNRMAFDGTNLWVTRAGVRRQPFFPVGSSDCRRSGREQRRQYPRQLKLLGTTHAVAIYSSALV